LLLQIDSSAVVEMEIIDSDESDYEVDFSSEPSGAAEAGTQYLLIIMVIFGNPSASVLTISAPQKRYKSAL